jgi:4-hydroxy-tetrahydrodipicolinate synthase
MIHLQGSITALVTPMRGGAVDEKTFEKFVDWQIKQGTSALVVCGTTGEAPTLTEAEEDRLFKIAVEVSAARVPVIAGTGSNCTKTAVERTLDAQRLGVDAALIVSPYYNKPTQEGLYQYFKAIHDATDIPLVVYNIPGRCMVDIQPPTMQRIAALPRYVAVKDATGDSARAIRTRMDCGPDFTVLSGDDALTPSFLAQGATGCISVTSNVAPRMCADMIAAWHTGERETFEALRDSLIQLHQVMFIEASPQPVKYALSLMGWMSEETRLPLVPCAQTTKATISEVMATMKKMGLVTAEAA